MKCVDCKEKKCVNGVAKVDKIYHEMSLLAEQEKKNKWKLVAILALVMLLLSNLLWLWNSKKHEKVTETTETVTYEIEGIEQKAEGNNHLDIVGGDKYGNTEN